MKTKSSIIYEREMFATRCVWLLLEYPPPLLCENSNFLPAFFSRPYNSTRTGPQNHPHPGAPQKSWYLWDWGHSKVQKLQAVCSIHLLILPNIGSWLVGWFVSPQRTNFWAQGHLRHIHNQCFFMMWPNHRDNFVVDKIRRQHSVHLWVTSK